MDTSLMTVLIGGVIISVISFCAGLLVSRGIVLKVRKQKRKAELNMLRSDAELLELIKKQVEEAGRNNVSHQLHRQLKVDQ
jgi:hydroxymethylglutaryl-CoA reductase